MSEADENTEEVIVEQPEPTETTEEVVKDEAPPEEDIQATLQRLKEQVEQEKQARLEAERQAREAVNREYQARNDKKDSDLQLVVNAIQTVKTNNSILQGRLAEAMAAGDYNQAAEVQREMSANEARLLQLENGKAAMEAEPKRQPPPIQDPVEAMASQLTPRSADWLRRHPEFARDGRLLRQMIAAHELAVGRGIQVDTDDYFANVENTLGLHQARQAQPVEPDDPMSQAAQVTQRRAAPPAAPVSRAPSSGTVVRLTPEEREMAGFMKMTPEEYARNKAALKKAGKIN